MSENYKLSGEEVLALGETEQETSEVLVKRDGQGNIRFYSQVRSYSQEGVARYIYWVTEDAVSTRRGLIRCIRHLSEKNWITPGHLRQLIDISNALSRKA